MSQKETVPNSSNEIELTDKEWKFLNEFSEPESKLWKKQLKKIDKLRKKYPPGSPAARSLDSFDPRTGEGERLARIANQALDAYHSGRPEEAQKLIQSLSSEK